jgi:very-short-patch-repair endonuclease
MVDQRHKPKWHVSEKQGSNARAVRRPTTEAERIICCNVRAPRFQGVSLRSPAPAGPYVVDLVCHAVKLTVEVDGGQREPQTIVHDARRDAHLAARGRGVVCFNNRDVMKDKARVLEETAVAFGGSETPSLTLRRTRERSHVGREDLP